MGEGGLGLDRRDAGHRLLTDGVEMVPAMGRSGGGSGRRPASTGRRRRRAKLGEAGGVGSPTPSGGGGS